ncbi:hypothetical protein, partial [Paenibacillus sp. CCS19]|uniref:hypothetical protein n=1 Tax=Paenibacillus sp. CCS19 TaxID=3158387 RepID=UPI00295EC009
EVEAQQCVQLTSTNRSRAYPKQALLKLKFQTFASSFEGVTFSEHQSDTVELLLTMKIQKLAVKHREG